MSQRSSLCGAAAGLFAAEHLDTVRHSSIAALQPWMWLGTLSLAVVGAVALRFPCHPTKRVAGVDSCETHCTPPGC